MAYVLGQVTLNTATSGPAAACTVSSDVVLPWYSRRNSNCNQIMADILRDELNKPKIDVDERQIDLNIYEVQQRKDLVSSFQEL